MKVTGPVYIGCGAGFSGDRFDAAGPIIADFIPRIGPKFLIFEVLAERTLALAQRARRGNPDSGQSPYVENYLRPILQDALRNDIRIISNMGSANPAAAARQVHALAQSLNCRPPRIFIVTGDDVREQFDSEALRSAPTMEGIDLGSRPIIAANAYLGARPIADALDQGADIVLVGRTTDSALALGPLIHAFGWRADAWDQLASGVMCGHLLECGGQVTGAYFADPGFKDVPDLANVGFPIAEVSSDGTCIITKPAGTGGMVSTATVSEQLLYEIHDPARYITPDVIADISSLTLHVEGEDRIKVAGVKGHPAPSEFKATICVENGWLGEASLSYAGPNALARAELALDIIRERMKQHSIMEASRLDIIGAGSVFDAGLRQRRSGRNLPQDGDYRIRAAILSDRREDAQTLTEEVQALYCSGPAGGGGLQMSVTDQVATASLLLDRTKIEPFVKVTEVTAPLQGEDPQ